MVTLSDIAKEVGVAPQVVSRVLNGGKGTASARAQVRDQIREVAARRGYRPFAAGQILRARAFHSVGVLIGHAQDFLISQDALAGLASGLSRHNYTATLHYVEATTDAELLDSRLLSSRLTDAIIMPYVRPPSRVLLRALRALPVPVIWMNRQARTDALAMDELGAGKMLARHLCEQGYRNITFVDYSSGGRDQHTRERMKGVSAAVRDRGLNVTFVTEQIARPDRATAARALLRPSLRRGAVIVNWLSAAQVILQVAQSLNWRIPEDLAIASFDDGRHHSASVPAITCAIRPEFQFGEIAAELILKRLQDPARPQPSRRLSFNLVVGGSTKR